MLLESSHVNIEVMVFLTGETTPTGLQRLPGKHRDFTDGSRRTVDREQEAEADHGGEGEGLLEREGASEGDRR